MPNDKSTAAGSVLGNPCLMQLSMIDRPPSESASQDCGSPCTLSHHWAIPNFATDEKTSRGRVACQQTQQCWWELPKENKQPRYMGGGRACIGWARYGPEKLINKGDYRSKVWRLSVRRTGLLRRASLDDSSQRRTVNMCLVEASQSHGAHAEGGRRAADAEDAALRRVPCDSQV